MYMMNIFAFRTTYPIELKKAKDPIGQDNNKWIKKISLSVDKSIGAWGNDGAFLNRSSDIKRIINNFHKGSIILLKSNKNETVFRIKLRTIVP